MRDAVGVAISALEVLLFELLRCQPGDEIKVVADVKGDSADGIIVSAITVSRGEGKVFFMDAGPLVLEGTLHSVGSYFLSAAKNFVLETLQPTYRHHLHSVGKLIAFARDVDLDAEFEKDAFRLRQQRRLESS